MSNPKCKAAVVFVTWKELPNQKELVDQARREGRDIITVPGTIAGKLFGLKDIAGRLKVSANRLEAGPNPASRLCAEHVRELGGESPLLNLMEVKS